MEKENLQALARVNVMLTERLLLWEPVVQAAREWLRAMATDDDVRGAVAVNKMLAAFEAIDALPHA